MVEKSEESAVATEKKKPSRSKLLKVPIRVKMQDGSLDDEFGDYVLEVDKDRIYVYTQNPFPANSIVHLGLDLPGVKKTIHFKGEVVRINLNQPKHAEDLEPGMGIVFERVSYDNRKLINDYLEKVQSENRSEEYSRFLGWIGKMSKPMGARERERIKKDLLKAIYGAKKIEPIPDAKRKKTLDEMDMISKIPLFEELDVQELEHMSRVMIREEMKAGQAVFEEGDVGDKMYIIVKGSIDIVKAGKKGPPQVLVTLKAGDYFGEMSLIDDAPRSAGAVAAEDTAIFSIKKTDLAALLESEPAIGSKIYKFFVIVLNQRLRETNEKIKNFVSMAQEMSQS